MLILKRFLPDDIRVLAIELRDLDALGVFFSNSEITFRVILPRFCSIWLKTVSDQIFCYLQYSSKLLFSDALTARTFLITYLNRVYYRNYMGLKTIGIGYKFIVFKSNRYIFISAGMSHLVAHRLHYHTRVYSLKKKKRLLTLDSLRKDLFLGECDFIRDLRPPDPYCGKGLRLFHEIYELKEGKKQIR